MPSSPSALARSSRRVLTGLPPQKPVRYLADEIAAHRRDDAEGAAVVAAFGDLEIGVVLRGKADALRRHQIGEGVVRLGQVLVHRMHDLFGGVRTGDGKHLRMRRQHDVVLRPQTAGDDHLAVFSESLADGVE